MDQDANEVHIEYIRDGIERIESVTGEIKNSLDEMNGRVRANEVDIATMKGKASVAGVVSGVFSGIVAGLAAAFGLNQ